MKGTTKMEKKATLSQLLIILLITIGIMFYETFVFMTIYNWFIPLATGWNKISYWLAMGIIILLDLIKPRRKSEDKTLREHIISICVTISLVSFFLGIAALVHLGV